MTGRAGRPRFDPRGIAVLMCNPRDLSGVRDKYILGGLEELYSKLASEPILRTHCMGLVASGYCSSFAELHAFFKATLYAYQFKDFDELYSLVEKVVLELKQHDLIREKNNVLVATPVGKRASELYLDPLTAVSFLNFLAREKKGEFDFLLAIQNASEARPLLSVTKTEEQKLWEEAYAVMENLSDFNALEKYKSAKLLNAWINEATEDEVLQNFDIPPGVLHARVRIMDWLSYSIQELAYLQNKSEDFILSKQMRRRIRHGIKKELLSVCSVKGIGRARGRRLLNAGIKTAEQLTALPKEEVKRILREK
jgi:helicase